MAANGQHLPAIGTRVALCNARTQLPEYGTVKGVGRPFGDNMVIVRIERDVGGMAELPLAALMPMPHVDPATPPQNNS